MKPFGRALISVMIMALVGVLGMTLMVGEPAGAVPPTCPPDVQATCPSGCSPSGDPVTLICCKTIGLFDKFFKIVVVHG